MGRRAVYFDHRDRINNDSQTCPCFRYRERPLYYGGSNGSGYNCSGMASTGAVQGCEVAVHNKWLTDDLDGLNSNPIILPLTSLSCPSAALTDSGPSSPYADVFKIIYYRGAVNAGGFWIPIYYKFCDGPKVDNYHLTAKPICPDHSKQTSTTDTTCTCDDNFVPNGSTCVPETYAIALSGLGVDVMPTKTLKAYAEVTSNATGSPKSGAQVTLILTVVPAADGQPEGAHVGSISPNGGSTDSYGKLSFVFTAPLAGGVHTITATCTNCTNNPVTGTIKVPWCQISPLTPLTDPVAIDFDNSVSSRWRPDGLTLAFQTHLACVEAGITAAGGTYTGTSAYRSFQYQRHLFEIVQKDKKLDTDYMTAHPECQALRNEITQEMGPSPGHGLKHKQKVATPGTSLHESGTAFDLTPHGLTDAQMAPIYAVCGVTHTAVPSEPWHVQ